MGRPSTVSEIFRVFVPKLTCFASSAILQQTFFPSSFADAVPFVRLKPGDARVWPSLNILVELRDGVTLQIPFREASKVCHSLLDRSVGQV